MSSFKVGPARVYLVRPESERDEPNHPGYRGRVLLRDDLLWMSPEDIEVLIGEEWMSPDTDAETITVPMTQVEMIEWGGSSAGGVEESSG